MMGSTSVLVAWQTFRHTTNKTSGCADRAYHQQARVENAFFRYKSIIGDGLRSRLLLAGGRSNSVERLAVDFAQTVVSSILEAF